MSSHFSKCENVPTQAQCQLGAAHTLCILDLVDVNLIYIKRMRWLWLFHVVQLIEFGLATISLRSELQNRVLLQWEEWYLQKDHLISTKVHVCG